MSAAKKRAMVDHFVHEVGTKRYAVSKSTLLASHEGHILGNALYMTGKMAFFHLTYGVYTRTVHSFQTLDYSSAKAKYDEMAQKHCDFPTHDKEGKPILQDA